MNEHIKANYKAILRDLIRQRKHLNQELARSWNRAGYDEIKQELYWLNIEIQNVRSRMMGDYMPA